MPRPLSHLGLALLARVEALPAALRPGRGVAGVAAPGGGGQDAHRLRVVRHEAADVVVGEAAVAVGGTPPGHTLHYTTLHYTTLPYTTLHYTTLHYTTLLYTSLEYSHPSMQVQYSMQSQLKWEECCRDLLPVVPAIQ